jgi:heat shock protein HslJ
MLPARILAAAGAVALAACSGATSRSANLPPVTPIMLPPAMAASAESDLTGGAWRWQTPAGDIADRYTIEFLPDNRVQVRADCNRGTGRYSVQAGGRLTLTGIALTKMGCGAGSLDAQFVRELGDVERYRMERDGLRLVSRGGAEMTFRR